MLKNYNIFSLQMIFSYGLAFVVLWEWLRPLPVITDTANLNVFVWFTLFCFVIMYLRLARYIAIPLIFIAIVYSLHGIFFEGSFLREGFHMLVWFGEDLARNVSYLKDYQQINHLSFEFRSFLLFVVLAIISYLIHFWLCHVKKIFFFLLITFIYITVIDTFTVYDASSAIIRLVVVGFLLTTLLFKIRLEEKEKIVSNKHRSLAWLNFAVLIIIVVTVSAFYAPKYEPLWPDPVPMFQGVISKEQGGLNRQQTIGYSQNDERLGGGFVDDSSTVFTAITKEGHYWRGESKEIYTGKGWESVPHELNRTFRYSDDYDAGAAVSFFERDVPSETLETTISMVDGNRFWHFFYAGELLEVNELEFYNDGEEQPFSYLIDYISGKVGTTAPDSSDPRYLKDYTFTHKIPRFSIDVLKNSSESDPEYIQEVYLQLPDMPDRIGKLASEITAEYDNRYQKVKAIESYFSENNFQYQTEDIAIPGPDQDYVDQFLFETQQGYCDNYSTAMVVMLRTLDIPARWVKGFTEGQAVENLEDDYRKYEVSNSNAHSWVEVYFEDVGWVPFEPTKGFSITVEFDEELSESENDFNEGDEGTDEETNPEREQDPENPFLPLDDELESGSGSGEEAAGNDSRLKLLQFPFAGLIVLIVIILGVCIMIWKRKKLITLFFLYLFKLRRNDGAYYVKAYQRLLWLLDLNGHKRLKGQTLREYALRIDELFNSTQMMELTLSYEKLYYGNRSEQHLWEEQKEQWEWLVVKISS